MRTPISFYGGKQRICKWIESYFPFNYEHLHYVEPFSGGAAMLFHKKPSVRESIGDIDGNVYAFWKVLSGDEGLADALIDKIKKIIHSEKEYKLCVKKLRSKNINDLTRAYCFFVASQMGFANKITGGYGWSRDIQKKEPLQLFNKVQSFKIFQNRLKYAQVFNRPAIEVIEKLDSKRTFFYLDPPYPGTFQGDYSGYSDKDFKDLVDCLRNLKGRWLLSCYEKNSFDIKTIAEHRASANTKTGFGIRSMSKPRKEMLFMNYKDFNDECYQMSFKYV